MSSATSQPPTGATILLSEDDQALATMVSDGLRQAGYCVWHATSAAETELLADEVRPDLVVLDLILPDASGLVLCATLKARLDVPVIICSASRRAEDTVLGLKLGAEDFVRKPFRLSELVARIEVALRRAVRAGSSAPGAPSAPRHQRVGDLVIDRSQREARIGERALPLTPTEYRLLCALASHPNEVVGRDVLADLIWGQHDPATDEALSVHMRRLRAKLDLEAPSGPVLTTMRGFGYRLAHGRAEG